ncbi:hypothetical protein A33Q_1447 [Indibacter alkaliphilus LW1]|uniref:Uncharacterized protein n=1 Tax=Indibacter alkaliphilus (strain CCUG 57479 / KCTC 22604 / LW1) TaxID=1189612 RepID=S2E903_INDAL|nr:hypothetical protein A33Q_1447 [Indibacter alkaliphilus LW1]
MALQAYFIPQKFITLLENCLNLWASPLSIQIKGFERKKAEV